MDPNELYGLAGIPIIVALVQAIKTALPELDSRFWPLVSIGLAIVFNLVLGWILVADLGTAAIVGLVVGLAASGLYSSARTAVRG